MKTNSKGLISNPYQVEVDAVPIRLYSKNCVDQYLWPLEYNSNANEVPLNYQLTVNGIEIDSNGVPMECPLTTTGVPMECQWSAN